MQKRARFGSGTKYRRSEFLNTLRSSIIANTVTETSAGYGACLIEGTRVSLEELKKMSEGIDVAVDVRDGLMRLTFFHDMNESYQRVGTTTRLARESREKAIEAGRSTFSKGTDVVNELAVAIPKFVCVDRVSLKGTELSFATPLVLLTQLLLFEKTHELQVSSITIRVADNTLVLAVQAIQV